MSTRPYSRAREPGGVAAAGPPARSESLALLELREPLALNEVLFNGGCRRVDAAEGDEGVLNVRLVETNLHHE